MTTAHVHPYMPPRRCDPEPTCSICLEGLRVDCHHQDGMHREANDNVVRLECGHVFCEACIHAWWVRQHQEHDRHTRRRRTLQAGIVYADPILIVDSDDTEQSVATCPNCRSVVDRAVARGTLSVVSDADALGLWDWILAHMCSPHDHHRPARTA
jgi:hypothetical protein